MWAAWQGLHGADHRDAAAVSGDGLMFPKPIPRGPKAKRWEKKKAKRLSRPGSDHGRLEFCRSLACSGVAAFPGHICRGDVQASHLRRNTGMARKEDDRKTWPLCAGLHLDEWERHRGNFADWNNERRYLWAKDRINETNLLWDALEESQRDWWRGQAEIARRRRAEALRSAS